MPHSLFIAEKPSPRYKLLTDLNIAASIISLSLAATFASYLYFTRPTVATWYRETGRLTASGVAYSERGYTCATDASYAFGTWVLVTSVEDGKQVCALVTDRKPSRGIDLTPAAFSHLAPLSRGVVKVKIQKLN